MKICPKCGTTHEKPGTFCSRSCANSRNFSNETKEKKRKAGLEFYSQFTDEERQKFISDKKLKYDFPAAQRKVQAKNRARAWSKPYEEMSHDSARKRLLYERNYTCEECGTGAEWNGKPLSLELDHIDGDHSNNKIENLRILCPNCHTQTPTHRSKNIRFKRLQAEKDLTEQ
jgi:Zn finger protein HypA/HybF involved in hydrogenase expression/predicted nucleic acid-binding Zn ribbon protein